jgi:hypothetical protein
VWLVSVSVSVEHDTGEHGVIDDGCRCDGAFEG